MAQNVVPDKTGRGVRERIIAESGATAEAAEGFFQVIGVVAFGRSGMAVCRVDTVTVIIVEEDVLLSQSMMVRGNEARINAEAGVAIALG